MKMSIARALKEKKRIIGEMNIIRSRINDSNVVQLTVKIVDGAIPDATAEEISRNRQFDPRKLLDDWYKLRSRLIAIKTALHTANAGIAEKLITLTELKAEISQIECTPLCSNDKSYANELYGRVVDVVFDRAYYMEKADKLRAEVNELQDAIDEYNATHYIEVAD